MANNKNNGYIAVRSDTGLRSLSINERTFLRSAALARESNRVLRVDGRGPGDVRKIRLSLERGHNGAVCTVQWGETRVSAEIKASLQPPSEDRLSEGVVTITVDTSPIASTAFGMMPPLTTTPGADDRIHFASNADETQKLLGNRILRCLERTILLGGALDTEALCVQSGAWVWRLSLSVRVLDHGGNLLDASVLASMATLRHYRKPQVDILETGGMPLLLHCDVREPTPLPLHHTPLAISFALIHADDVALSTSTSTVAAIVDPTDREELVQTGSISLAMNVHSEVCLLDFGGGCEVQPKQLKKCWKLAEKCILQLCDMLETCLKEADEKAQQERLHRLQSQQHGANNANLPPLVPPGVPPGVPFWQEDGDLQVDTATDFMDVSKEVEEAAEKVHNEVEEAYRLQALEYNQGHVAAKVKDQSDRRKNRGDEKGGALLTAMLQSVQKAQDKQAPEPSSSKAAATPDQRSNGGLSTEQADEFAQVVAAAKSKSSAAAAMDLDNDDEEEAPTVLKSEFESVQPKAETKAATANHDDDDDIDDLAMAIKSKSKKKKKTKKSK